ncbi:hypothetical protein MBLNU230_g3864t1 [Neophaeotheca triangularis]
MSGPEFQKAFEAADTKHETPSWHDKPQKLGSNVSDVTERANQLFLGSQAPTGEIKGISSWQTANGYTALALYDKWSGSKKYYNQVADAAKKYERRQKEFIGEFNDETLWWAVLCCHLYEVGNDQWFLQRAKNIWYHIRDGRFRAEKGQVKFKDQDMHGGVYRNTKPGEEQINSITTGLCAELSARLAIFEGKSKEGDKTLREEYLQAARDSLGWVLRCRYHPKDAVVLDGFNLKKNEASDKVFTHLAAVTLGACTQMFEATKDKKWISLACHIAHKAMRNNDWVENDGVLTDKAAYAKGKQDPTKSTDSVGFKSVLIRQLADLLETIKRTQPGTPEAKMEEKMIVSFISINFDSLQSKNTNGNGQYGPWWNGPFESPTTHSQMAVLDVMAAAKLIEGDSSVKGGKPIAQQSGQGKSNERDQKVGAGRENEREGKDKERDQKNEIGKDLKQRGRDQKDDDKGHGKDSKEGPGRGKSPDRGDKKSSSKDRSGRGKSPERGDKKSSSKDRSGRDKSPQRKGNSPQRKGKSPERGDRKSNDKDNKGRDQSPQRKGKSPERGDRKSGDKDKDNKGRDQSPQRKGKSPERGDKRSNDRDNKGRDKSPQRRGNSPQRKGNSPPRRGNSPGRNNGGGGQKTETSRGGPGQQQQQHHPQQQHVGGGQGQRNEPGRGGPQQHQQQQGGQQMPMRGGPGQGQGHGQGQGQGQNRQQGR